MASSSSLDYAICRSLNFNRRSTNPALLSAQIGAFPVAILGKLFFIPISSKLAGKNQVYAGALIYGNVTSFTALTYWCLLKIISELDDHINTDYHSLRDDKSSRCRMTAFIATATGLGILSQTPIGYLAYEYNRTAPLTKAIITNFSESAIPAYSILLSLNQLPHLKADKAISQLQKVKAFLCEKIHKNQEMLAFLPRETQKDIAHLLTTTDSEESSILAEQLLLSAITPFSEPFQNTPSACQSAASKIIGIVTRGFGELLWGAKVYLDGYLTYRAVEQWQGEDGHEGLSIASGIAVGAATAYLSHKTISLSSQRVATLFTSLFNRRIEKKNLAFDLHPRLVTALMLVAIATLSLAHGPSVQISRDYFEGNLSQFFQITFPISIVFMIGTAMVDLVQDVVLHWEARFGKDEKKLVAQLYLGLDELTRVIKTTSYRKLGSFVLNSSDELFSRLEGSLGCSRDSLRELLQDEGTALLAVNSS